MEFVVVDTEKMEVLCEFSTIPCPFSFVASGFKSHSKEITEENLEEFLEKRCVCERTLKFDKRALEILGIEKKACCFGRMCDEKWAVGYVTYFESPRDNILVMPKRDEVLSFLLYNEGYYQKYTLRGWNDGTYVRK